MFDQVPMVEIDGMKLAQTRAILNYIATKYDLYGKDMKERALYGDFLWKRFHPLLSEHNHGKGFMNTMGLCAWMYIH